MIILPLATTQQQQLFAYCTTPSASPAPNRIKTSSKGIAHIQYYSMYRRKVQCKKIVQISMRLLLGNSLAAACCQPTKGEPCLCV